MLSLEECYHGCIKKMKFERQVMNDDGHTSSMREKVLTITVKKGWTPGTKIIFEKEGSQGPNNIPADIEFIVQDRPHPIFKRDGINLVYKHKISLGLALIGTTIHVPTLDDRVLDIPITDVVFPGYKRIIPGEGMPRFEDWTQRGDLVIEFDIEFPKSLSLADKDLIRQALLVSPDKKKHVAAKKEAPKTISMLEDDE